MSLFVYEVFQVDYILVENGEVKGYPQSLPVNWANVSNFYLLDNETLKSYGWYPVRFVSAQKTDNDLITGQSFVIEGNEVVHYEQIRPKTQEEIDIENDGLWKSVRTKRNILLQESDWTQIPDSPLSDGKKLEWQSYRLNLRNITNQQDPKNIVWPIKPV
jgi:hypothetical protein